MPKHLPETKRHRRFKAAAAMQTMLAGKLVKAIRKGYHPHGALPPVRHDPLFAIIPGSEDLDYWKLSYQSAEAGFYALWESSKQEAVRVYERAREETFTREKGQISFLSLDDWEFFEEN